MLKLITNVDRRIGPMELLCFGLIVLFAHTISSQTLGFQDTLAGQADTREISKRTVSCESKIAQEKSSQAETVHYAVDQSGITLTPNAFCALSNSLQESLCNDGLVNPDVFLEPVCTFNAQVVERQVFQPRSSSTSLVITTENFDYLEDSGAQKLIQHPVEIAGPTVDFVTVEMLNILDTGNELLSVTSFTKTHTVDVDGRNVTFDYEITPVSTYDNGILNISSLANNAEYEDAISTLAYENTREEPTARLRGVKIVVHQGSNSASANVYFDVVNVNDPPYFIDQPGRVETNEDRTLYLSISSTSIPFLDGVYTDSDMNSEMGIAVLGADNSNGEWKYMDLRYRFITIPDTSRDDEGNVLRNISLSQTVLVLYQNYIAFEPRLNFYGETTLTVVAWDRTGASASLSHGSYTNATWFPSGPFSDNMATVTLAVRPVNDAPTVDLDPAVLDLDTMNEDTGASPVIKISKLADVCSDVDVTPTSSGGIGVAITNLSFSNGLWQYSANGDVWQNITKLTLLLSGEHNQSLRFIPNDNFSGTANVTYRCWDYSVGSPGDEGVTASYEGATGGFSELEVTGILTVLNTNDPPYFVSNMTLPVYRQAERLNQVGCLVNTLLLDAFRDIDPDNSPGMAVVNVEEHGSGTFEYRCLGTSLVFASWFPFAYLEGPGYTLSYNTPSDSHATLLSSTCQLRFKPNSTLDSHPAPYIEVLAWDGSNKLSPGSYGINTQDTNANSFGKSVTTIVVVEVEPPDRPQLSGSSDVWNYTEGMKAIAIFQDLVLSEETEARYLEVCFVLHDFLDTSDELVKIGSDYEYLSVVDLVNVTELNPNWSSDGRSLCFTGNISRTECQATIRSISYMHTAKNPSPGIRRLQVSVTNDIGVQSDEYSVKLKVVGVNDKPVLFYEDGANLSIVQFHPEANSSINIYSPLSIGMEDPDDKAPSIVKIKLESAYDGSMEKLSIPDTTEVKEMINSSHSILKSIRTTWSYESSTTTLLFTVSNEDASFIDYQVVLAQVTYSNLAANPNPQSRRFSLSILDSGSLESNTLETDLLFMHLNGSATEDVTSAPEINPTTIASAGNIAPPKILKIVAFPYAAPGKNLHTDAKISGGDEIRIVFDADTNMAPHGVYDANDVTEANGKILRREEVDELFVFSSSLVQSEVDNAYSGEWLSSRMFSIKLLNEGYPQASVKVGQWTLIERQRESCAKEPDASDPSQKYCIRDSSGQSTSAIARSPALEGNWGLNVPDLTSVVWRNVSHYEDDICIEEGSYAVATFRPALSSEQLALFCNLEFNSAFRLAPTSQLRDLNITIADCSNQYIADWDEAFSKFGKIPTASNLKLVVHGLHSCQNPHTISTLATQYFDRSSISAVVAETTGVAKRTLVAYSTSNSIYKSKSFLVEHNYRLTPTISSWSVSKPNAPDGYAASSPSITSNDEITIEFDQQTDMPAVSTHADLSKILSISPNCVSYYGEWRDSKTLRIVLSNITAPINELTMTFKANVLEDQSPIPSDFLNGVNCLGSAVCGPHNSSVGICNNKGTSCRVHGSYIVKHGSVTGVGSDLTPLVPWWWLLLLGILLLLCLIFLCALGHQLHRKQTVHFLKPPIDCGGSNGSSNSDFHSKHNPFRYSSETDTIPTPLFSKRETLSTAPRSEFCSATPQCSKKRVELDSSSIFSVFANIPSEQQNDPTTGMPGKEPNSELHQGVQKESVVSNSYRRGKAFADSQREFSSLSRFHLGSSSNFVSAEVSHLSQRATTSSVDIRSVFKPSGPTTVNLLHGGLASELPLPWYEPENSRRLELQ